MPDPTIATWSAEAETIYRDGVAVGTLDSAEIAEWVADACNILAEMDKAQAEWEASGEAPNCAMVDIDGEQMRVQGGADWTEQDRREMGQILSAAKRRMAEEKTAERAEIERQVREECAALLRRDAAGHRQRGLGTSEHTQELMGHYAGVLEIAADRIARGES